MSDMKIKTKSKKVKTTKIKNIDLSDDFFDVFC